MDTPIFYKKSITLSERNIEFVPLLKVVAILFNFKKNATSPPEHVLQKNSRRSLFLRTHDN